MRFIKANHATEDGEAAEHTVYYMDEGSIAQEEKYDGKGYQPTYTRTKLTDALHEAFGFCTSKEIVPIRKMEKICADTKRQRD